MEYESLDQYRVFYIDVDEPKKILYVRGFKTSQATTTFANQLRKDGAPFFVVQKLSDGKWEQTGMMRHLERMVTNRMDRNWELNYISPVAWPK